MQRYQYEISLRNQKGFRFLQWVALFVLPILWGCGAPVAVPALAPEEISTIEAAGNYPHDTFRIEQGDTVLIKYTFHPEMDQEEAVRPDGKITAKMVGEIIVAGMTTTRLEKLLVERTSDRLRNPEVVVSISKFAARNIYIGGEVGNPGRVPYRKGLTPLQAIIARGGFMDTAQADSVILVRAGGSDNNFISRKLNLAEAITDGIKEPLYLAPYDVVYVPKSAIANANLWVKQHISQLLPFLGRSPVGFALGFLN